jgi:hypothetical protein
MNHHGSARQTPRRHVRSRAMPTTPKGRRRSSTKWYPRVPATYVSSSKRRGCRRSTALGPTWVRLRHVSSRLTHRPRLMQPWLTSGLPHPRWKKGVRRTSLRHLRRVGICAVDLIDLRIASSTPSRRRSTNPGQTPRRAPTCTPTSTRTGTVAMLVAPSTNAIVSVKSGSIDVAWTTIASTAPRVPSTASWCVKSAIAMTSRTDDDLVRGGLRPP